MKMLDSLPKGSEVVMPSSCPEPDCASEPVNAFELMMNCRSVPWQGKYVLLTPLGAQFVSSRVLTIVSKLKPKSTLLMVLPLETGSNVASVCGVRVELVSDDKDADVVFEGAS